MDEKGFKKMILELFQLDDDDIDMDLGWRENLISSIEITELVVEMEKNIRDFDKERANEAIKNNATLNEIFRQSWKQ